MEIKVKKVDPRARIPEYGHPGDVGMDFFALDGATIGPGESHIFNTGIAIEFPVGYTIIVKDRSSVSKLGLHTFGGVYDAGYRGTYNIGLTNHTPEPITIEDGQKIAQGLLLPVEIATFVETDEFSESSRGDGNFGSTGKF